jgi:hypothetical protein
LVNVSKTTDGMVHEFAPASEYVALAHFREAQIEFVDESVVAVEGAVRYDFEDRDFDGPCTYEQAGACYCPVRDTVIIVDRGGADVESYPTDAAGAFAFSAAYGQNVTISLRAVNPGAGRNHTFGLAVDRGAAGGASESPSVTFVADEDTYLDFVASDETDVKVGVLGGQGVAYATGQPVAFGMEGCPSFARQLYTCVARSRRGPCRRARPRV